MAVYADREAFIPYRKADVVELCIEDGKLSPADAKKFREFCEILGAYYHFDFHHDLEAMKQNFSAFDPDADTKPRIIPTPEQKQEMQGKLVEELSSVLEKANYRKLTEQELQNALEQESLITLRMHVDFNDYETWTLYHRGSGQQTVELKKMFGLKKVPLTMDIFERVVLLIKFKNRDYFLQKFKGNKKKVDALNFEPGKMYLYMYKNIPQADLEVLFPNVDISMNFKDLMMLWVPAAGAGIATLIKVLPNLIIILGVLSAVMFGKEATGLSDPKGIIAGLSGLAVLGGFVFKQYIAYKNKRIQFLKQVSDTLFFKNLVCNAGVFNALIDAAEDEECKEVFLAYYHLLTNPPLTKEQLDDTIEQWLETKFSTKIDFDVDKALQQMEKMRGKIVQEGVSEEDTPEKPLLVCDDKGVCHVLAIDDAKTMIDYIWDNIFQYNE